MTTLEIAEKLLTIFRMANSPTVQDKAREDYARRYYEAMVWCMAAMEGKNGRGWTPVEEKPPEGDTDVLVYVTEGKCKGKTLFDCIEVAEYDPEWGWILEGFNEPEELTITHWMPLPEGPEVEA